MKNKFGIILTIIFTVFLGILYFLLESFHHSDFGCGCSSACTGYYPVLNSRLIGYCLLIGSTILFIASIWKVKGISKYWSIPAVIIFAIAFYGNGYLIFNKGLCGFSLNKTTFFINQTNLGDFAKPDGELIDLDHLKNGQLEGKLLGYSIEGKELTVFRIGEEPLKIKTSFMFWKVPHKLILNNAANGLNAFESARSESSKGHYEFIGGQGMTEKDFLNEFALTQKHLSDRFKNNSIKDKKIINNSDGTTRFILEMDER